MHVGEKFKTRTRTFASEVIRLCGTLGNDHLGRLIRPQLLRAGTGVACNYRAVWRSRSSKEFASRLAVVIEEADEAEFWLDMLSAHVPSASTIAGSLQLEAAELRAMFVRSRSTVLESLREDRDGKG